MTQTSRVWLITGCSAGFGRELALAALAAGDRVMATARDPQRLAELARAGGDRVRTTALDVTDERQAADAVARTLDEFGRIDVVVNNAGHGSVGAVEELDERRALMEVMFFGAVAAAVDAMDGTQPGDPRKAARAVLEVIDHPEPPLRLALGDDAVDHIAVHHERLRAELARWEKLSRSVAISDGSL